ncbi:MAG: TIGR04255 family protein [Actinomycetota bacterium]|nr:TIGR04255 family protein [Actinomycetota bacterium]
MAPLQLPDPRDVVLPRSPLSLVVCQVRHDRVLAVADPRRGLAVQESLGGRYPEIEERQVITASLAVVGGGAPQVTQDKSGSGWQMKSEDGTWTVTLQPEFFSLETSAYEGWQDFRQRLEALVRGVIAAYEPALEARIGLRYVDEITDPRVTSPRGWRGWIRDELLGPVVHPLFGDAIRGVQQHVEFDAEGGYRVVLRHGTSPIAGEDQWVYLLDHDCFRQAGRALTADTVMTTADHLHRAALQVFQAAITDKLYSYLAAENGQ